MDKKRLRNCIDYLWSDYKWPLLACLTVLLVVGSCIAASCSGREMVLSIMLVDCHTDVSADRMAADYAEAAGLDGETQMVEVVNNLMFSETTSGSYALASLSRFLSDIGCGKLDVCGMMEEEFLKYDRSGSWMDLRSLPGFSEWSAAAETLESEDGRVIGIYAGSLPVMRAYGCYENPQARGVIGVACSSAHMEEASSYLRYLAGMAADR